VLPMSFLWRYWPDLWARWRSCAARWFQRNTCLFEDGASHTTESLAGGHPLFSRPRSTSYGGFSAVEVARPSRCSPLAERTRRWGYSWTQRTLDGWSAGRIRWVGIRFDYSDGRWERAVQHAQPPPSGAVTSEPDATGWASSGDSDSDSPVPALQISCNNTTSQPMNAHAAADLAWFLFPRPMPCGSPPAIR